MIERLQQICRENAWLAALPVILAIASIAKLPVVIHSFGVVGQLTLLFSSAVICAVGIFFSYQHRHWVAFEWMLLVFVIQVLMMLGLMVQSAQTPLTLNHCIMLWSALTLPVILFGQKQWSIGLWLTVLCVFTVTSLNRYFGFGNEVGNQTSYFTLFFTLPFVCSIISELMSNMKRFAFYASALHRVSIALGVCCVATLDYVISHTMVTMTQASIYPAILLAVMMPLMMIRQDKTVLPLHLLALLSVFCLMMITASMTPHLSSIGALFTIALCGIAADYYRIEHRLQLSFVLIAVALTRLAMVMFIR